MADCSVWFGLVLCAWQWCNLNIVKWLRLSRARSGFSAVPWDLVLWNWLEQRWRRVACKANSPGAIATSPHSGRQTLQRPIKTHKNRLLSNWNTGIHTTCLAQMCAEFKLSFDFILWLNWTLQMHFYGLVLQVKLKAKTIPWHHNRTHLHQFGCQLQNIVHYVEGFLFVWLLLHLQI